MAIDKSRLITYKRDKNKAEIVGEAPQVKWLIWIDLISYWLCNVIPLLFLLWMIPKIGVAFVVLKWLKRR
jgi:hypothetical protein